MFRETAECVERVLSESTRQRETFQKTLRALKTSLDEKVGWVFESNYRVTHHVVLLVLFTSEQKLHLFYLY